MGASTAPYDETQYFWVHLNNANLISANLTALNCGGALIAPDSAPPIKFRASGTAGPAGWWVVHRSWNESAGVGGAPNTGSAHSLWITSDIGISGSSGGAALFVADAGAIDVKVDDGLPTTGKIQSTDNTSYDPWGPRPAVPGVTGSDSCVADDVTPYRYNYTASNATDNSKCGLLWGTSF